MEMLNSTLFILGGNGIIGSSIKELYFNNNNVKFLSRDSIINPFDLSQPTKFSYDSISKNDQVLLLSAISKPVDCENLSISNLINVINTKIVIKNILERGAHLIFASSDTVYGGGDQKTYNENDILNPKSKYAEQKAIIEEKFKNCLNFSVFRFSQCLSGYDSFSKYLIESINNNQEISINTGFYRNIFDQFLLKLLIDRILLNSSRPSIMNIGGDICEDRYDFFEKLILYYPKITLKKYEDNNKDKIAKIKISNKVMKSYLSINEYKFNYGYFINKIINK
jgi:dTDP-4-dehydrorhamnose reductase